VRQEQSGLSGRSGRDGQGGRSEQGGRDGHGGSGPSRRRGREKSIPARVGSHA
jgi:hypothetical protein